MAEIATLPHASTRPAGPDRRLGWSAVAWDGASFAILVTLVLLAWATFRDYGITWDETWHKVYGQYILDWYLSGFADRSALSYRGDYLYGGGFDALGAVLVRLSPMAWYDTLHLLGAMVGVLGVAGAWRLGRVLGGPSAGFFATALLATTSVYYGHMFNNPKDIPFATGYVLAMSELVLLVRTMPRIPRRRWIAMGLAAGAAMSVRIGGLLILCYLLAAMVAVLAHGWWRTGSRRWLAHAGGHLAARFFAILGLAWVVMLLPWPWALRDPIRRPFFALGRMTRFNLHVRKMPFGDQQIQTFAVPWDYLPRYFAFKLPETLLVLALAAAIAGGVWAWRRGRDVSAFTELLVGGVLALAILFPPLWAIALRSTLYDGLRHFLFLVPMLAAIAGWFVVRAMAWMDRRGALPGWTLGAVVLAGCAAQVPVMAELHPHEYVYFNRLAGRLPGVYKRYDTDYYGNGYREAFDLLRDKLWQEDPEGYLSHRFRVSGCIPGFVAKNYLDDVLFWKEPEDKERAEFFLAYQRNDCHDRYRLRPIYGQVERQGTPIILIRDLRAARREDEPVPVTQPRPRATPRPRGGKKRTTGGAPAPAPGRAKAP